MTAEQYLSAIKKHKIKVSPILGERKKIIVWQAGRVSVVRGVSFVNTTDFAQGSSPEDAVEKLLKGQTEFKRSIGGVVLQSKRRIVR